MGSKLWTQHVSNGGYLTDNEIAEEPEDLFLAGMDTAVDTLSYVFWLLTKPENVSIHGKLRPQLQVDGISLDTRREWRKDIPETDIHPSIVSWRTKSIVDTDGAK